MPGKKYASIKKPSMYEGLKRHGFSKSSAARISNWWASHPHGRRGRRRRRR